MDQDNTTSSNSAELPSVDGAVSAVPSSQAEPSSNNLGLNYTPPSQSPISTPQQQPVQSNSTDDSTVVSSVSTPAIADDVDLIEKEWVEKAKEIVYKTKDNPYLQSKALSEVKADYIKKRYNKDILKSDE